MEIVEGVPFGERPASTSTGAHPDDPWYARLAFHLLQKVGPGWLTLWLVLIIGGLIALGVVAGPWVPSVIAATGALTAGGTAVAKRIGAKPADPMPATQPEPAVRPLP
jgi:hypothetical protein